MDYVVIADREYREAMQRGSDELLAAINWARKGYNPATRTEPIKLPPDWSNRNATAEVEPKERAPRRASNERIREMMERNMKAGEIARELKMNHQKVVWAMKSIRLERRSDRQMEMIRKGLWG